MMLTLKRADIVIDGHQYGGHRMLTLGTESLGLRVTMGNLDRHGHWHARRPDVFLLFRGRRV